jgi:hypothetical protein
VLKFSEGKAVDFENVGKSNEARRQSPWGNKLGIREQ